MNAPVTTPLNTLDRVAEMMATLEEFSTLLELETAAVRDANVATIGRLAERKEYLALHYQRQLKMLNDRRGDVAELARGHQVQVAVGLDEIRGDHADQSAGPGGCAAGDPAPWST